jgi:hypothetical protein
VRWCRRLSGVVGNKVQLVIDSLYNGTDHYDWSTLDNYDAASESYNKRLFCLEG